MTFIIAEAGINHCGSITRAMQMVEVAAKAGADAVKFQSFTAERLGYEPDLTEKLCGWQLSESQHVCLFDHARDLGIEFMSTPFDAQWCDFLVELGVKRLKISSGKVKDLEFVRHVAGKGLPLIMSTGMATEDQLWAACDAVWTAKNYAHLLYCVSEYPTPLHKISFRKMYDLIELTDLIGFSDHTMGIAASVIAAASGAQVVEKHFTLDRNLPGPDQCCSIEPQELAEMVREIRNVA